MEYVVEPEQRDRNVVTVRIPTVRDGWSQKFLLLSDIHFDSPHCSRKLLKKLLDDAVSCGAGIIITGDLFDIMGGRNDRRGSKGSLRSEYKEDGYINKVIDDVVEFFTPYKDNIIFISTGNHETAILKIVEYDLLDTVCRRLGVKRQGYAGFCDIKLSQGNGSRCSKKVYFHHGSAGGEVTHGVLRAQRESAKVVADIYIGGHCHETWMLEDCQIELNNAGRIVKKTRVHISIPTLKDEYDMFSGYHIEKDRAPRPLGGFWMELYWNPSEEGNIGHRFYKAD